MKSFFLQYKRFPFFNKLSKMGDLAIVINSNMKNQDEDEECTICQEKLGKKRMAGPAEDRYILPCGHVFGSECITTWLQTSSFNKDCPICRRSMLYRGCGHAVLPLLAPAQTKTTLNLENYQPQAIPEAEMPEKCPVCRQDKLEAELRWMERRKETEEGVLRSLRVLPGILGGMSCRLTAMDIERRVQQNRSFWMAETDGWVERRRREVGWIW